MSRDKRNWKLWGALALLIATSTCRVVGALDFTYIGGSGPWHLPQAWAPFAPPAVMGPPGIGDTANVFGGRTVHAHRQRPGLGWIGDLRQCSREYRRPTN